MPSAAPGPVDPLVDHELHQLGTLLRTQRKSMRLPAESVARAANMSRQTLHRIERGEPSVTMGAYLNAVRALGLSLNFGRVAPSADVHGPVDENQPAATAPNVRLQDYPQLRQLAWHRQGDTLSEEEALDLYERHWRHVDTARLTPSEQALIRRLIDQHGRGTLLV